MATKTKFVALRMTQAEQEKALMLSLPAGSPGNLSAGLRWALEQVKVSGEVRAELAEAPTGSRPERALVAA